MLVISWMALRGLSMDMVKAKLLWSPTDGTDLTDLQVALLLHLAQSPSASAHDADLCVFC